MRKRDLLTTALCLSALVMSSPAFAARVDYVDAAVSGNSYSITEKTISGNSTEGMGGAYWFTDSNATSTERSPLNVAISNTVFENNQATSSGYGGVMYVANGTVNIDNGTFKANTAGWDGGAISTRTPYGGTPDSGPKLVINNSLFESNEATVYSGGAIGLYSEAEINNTKFIGNNAGGHNPADSTDGGGAIYLGGWGQLTLNNSEFTGNTSNRGGAIGTTDAGIGTTHYFNISNTTFDGNSATLQGGAIFSKFTDDNAGNHSTITGSTFTNNTAGQNGGAVYNKGTLAVDNSDFDNNTAQFGGGFFNETGATANLGENLSFTNNTAQKNGGGVYNYTGATMTIGNNAYFSGNKAVEAAGGAVQNMGNLTLGDNITFENNSAAWGGAAVYGGSRDGQGSSTTIGNNAVFKNNTLTASKSYGGAIYLENDEQDTTSFTLGTNSYFEGNSAYQGGAIFINEAINAEIGQGAAFNGNTASNHGGAIYNKSDISLSDATFANNTASKYGGAIYNDTGANINLGDNTKFDNNTANLGGAVYGNKEGSVTLGANAEFTNNTSNSHGGAVYLTNGHDLTVGDNAKFVNNTANGTLGNGGAIYSYNSKTNSNTVKIGNNAEFSNNSTLNKEGGAIYNGTNTTLEIGSNSVFANNSANGTASKGGAIYNIGSAMTIGDNASFTSNKAVQGGAIFQGIDAELSLNNATFTQNIATGNETSSAGGAIFISEKNTKDVNITNSIFDGNKSDAAGGAILQANGSTSTINIDNTIFTNNETGAEGGALVSDSILNITNSTFSGNKTTGTNIDPDTSLNSNGGGGAIFLYDKAKVSISNSNFDGNSSGTYGGAIGTRINASSNDSSLSVENSNFTGNSANADGGAIAAFIDTTVKDTSFVNNSAGGNGGAIYAKENLSVSADQKDVIFSGNSAADGGDIYMAGDAGKELNMSIGDDKSVVISGGVSGANKYNMNVNGTGTLNLQSYIKNADITVNDMSTLWLNNGSQVSGNNNTITLNDGTELLTINNRLDNFEDGLFTVNGEVSLGVDADIASGTADRFGAINYGQDGKIVIEGVKPTNTNSTKDNFSFNIFDATGIDKNNARIDEDFVAMDTLSPIRWLKGSIDENGIVTYGARGNGWRDFNPSVLVSPVAAQLGGYLVQLNSYDQAFMNLDMKMLMTQEERKAQRMKNSYAAAGNSTTPMVYSPTYLPEKDSAGWVRPYATFENVGLNGGPRVSNVMYGTFFGADSEMYEFKNGAEAQFSVYAGYNGSHQAFTGNSLYQNGGTLGLTGIVYKGNFFTALTANAGASVVDASTMYGNEDFPMLMAGVASKTGYNWELAKGKFIIQPNYLMSYTFVNTFDYTNAAGVRMKSDPLNAINIAPGVKFIGNLKNGWQPYINLRMVWNIMDKTDFLAANTSIPDLSVRPYFEYGLGLQKRWGDRFTGFGQVMMRNGGRNGVSLGFGFRWAFGKGGTRAYNNSHSAVIKEPTKMKLSNIK